MTGAHRREMWRPALLIVTAGLAVGVLTSFGQKHLSGALNALVNSASAWLLAPFFVGSRMPTRRSAAIAGLTVCALQLVGYYATTELRGFSAGRAIITFWAACAVVGGPLFGVAGHLWHKGPASLRGLGGTALPAAFLAEGLWSYVHQLHYYGTAALWFGIAVALALLLNRDHPADLRWLPLTVILGLAGEIVVSTIYRQSF
jgi:hypothetical protein